ncbi:13392_t:CDS:1, partial [Funneliformis mosseae]
GFCSVNNSTKLEELTVYSYDTRLKEKQDARLMKDIVLIDLQENNLHSLNAYIKTINAVVNIPSMQQYIQKKYIIPVVADWPEQIYLRTAIS